MDDRITIFKNYFVLLVDSIYNRMQTQKCHQKVSSKSVFKRCLQTQKCLQKMSSKGV